MREDKMINKKTILINLLLILVMCFSVTGNYKELVEEDTIYYPISKTVMLENIFGYGYEFSNVELLYIYFEPGPTIRNEGELLG